MENMASFPDLRPHRRSAKAESSVASKTRTRLLLVVSATLLFTAFVAVTELATLRGKKAHDASAFLTRELGPPLDSAPLVRTPAHGVDVSVSPQGFHVKRGPHSLGLALVGGKPQHVTSFAHGISTKTDFGRTVVAVSPKKTEQYLVVDKHYGTKTWSWQLDTAGLTPRVGGDGSVGFIAGHRLTDQFVIAAPTILDLRGRDISPRGLHWDVARREGKWSLELAFDDSNLATPYVIDPASFNNGAGTVGPTAAAANIALTLPGSIKLGDLLIAHVTWKGGSNITATEAVPGTWTQLDVTRNQATNIGAQVWYKNATVADTTGGSYTWNFAPNAIATGGIAAYTGIDKSATPAVSGIATAATNDNAVYYPAITPSANGAQVISVVGWNRVSNGGNLTPPAAVNGAAGAPGIATDRWETVNSGAITSELSDFTQNVAAGVNTPGSNNAGGSGKNIAHVAFRIALKADITAPTSSFALSSVSPAGSAYYSGAGTTVWYRGTGPNCAAEVQVAGKCSFKITNTVSDAGSGPASSIFAALGSPGTHWTFTNGTVTTPAGGPYVSNFYAWSTGATETPTDLITGTDGGGNTDGGTTLTFNNDVTGPAVPTPTVTAQYYTSLSVPVSLGAATDTGGSGVNAGSITVERDTSGLAAGACGAFTGSWSTVTLSAGNDTTVTSGNCYRYREIAADNVGNSTTSGISNVAKVDTSAPSTPGLTFSGLSANAYWNSGTSTFYFRASAGGTFTVTALSTDSESAIGSYTFGTLNSNGGSNWGGSLTGDHYDYTFGASTTAPTTSRTVNSTNGAGTNSANATYSIANDATGPAVPTPSVTAQYYTSLSVPVTLGAATDTGGSGVNAATITVERDTIGLAAGACGAFTGSWSTVTLSAGTDTTVTSGNCYRYREIAADNVGNSTTSG